MDFLERPEIKKTYEKCKYIVKVWEHNFKKSNGRLPSKLDIHEADQEVRHAYRKYYQLKTKALEQSFKDIEGFESAGESSPEKQPKPIQEEQLAGLPAEELACDDVWGPHLNNAVKNSELSKETNNKTNNVNSFSQKLFCGSKFTKRNPRKSLSFTQKLKSEPSFDAPTFLSQPSKSFADSSNTERDELSFEGLFPNNAETDIKFTNVQEKVAVQNINVVQSVLDENYKQKPLKKVDSGWLERVGLSAGVSIENPQKSIEDKFEDATEMNLNYGSDDDDEDIIDNSDDESLALAPRLKKPKLAQSINSLRNIPLEPNKMSNNEKTTDSQMKMIGKILDSEPLNAIAISTHNNMSISTNSNINNNLLNITANNLCDTNSKIVDSKKRKKFVSVEKPEKVIKKKTQKKDVKLHTDKPFDVIDEPWDAYVKKVSSKVVMKKKMKKENSVNNCDNSPTPLRHSERSTKANVSMAESHSEEDPFQSDNDSDPEFSFEATKFSALKQFLMEEGEGESSEASNVSINYNEYEDKPKRKSSSKSKNKVTPKRKSIQNSRIKEDDKENDEEQTYELEYSIIPRVSTPRFKNIKKLIKIETSTAEEDKNEEDNKTNSSKNVKQQLAKEKLQKKIESGSLNENFVTINLKKKIYARGKKTMTFSKYKKQMWKNKKKALAGPNMDMGGCDGGMLTCFNCGDIGHFAAQCKKAKGDQLLPLAADEEVCPYPTLEEAAKAAKDCVFAVRTPNLEVTSTENPKEDESKEEEKPDDDDGDDLFDEVETEALLAETLKLEEHVAKLDLQIYVDKSKIVKPYYELKEDGKLIDTPQEVFDALKRFGHSSFRAGQEQAVMRILSGKSTLVTLSTGSGKSLCYQLPAYLYSLREPCISLIVSPLVSLMEDQVLGIPNFLKAACLHTNQTKVQREKIMESISSGLLNILLVSPEAVVAGERSTGFGSLLRKLPPIAFACIDEAHCVSQWSHNFRPSYLMICRVLRERMGVKTVLGLTATATRSTSDSIINHLQIPDGRNGIISDIPLPDNLLLTVSRDHQRDNALLALLNSDRFKNCNSIIIYCTRRDECNRITTFLRTSFRYETTDNSQQNGKKRKRVHVEAEPYHAGLSASRRRTIQKAFMSGELRIVVATVAFGMGINKKDIRAVIHYNMPKSFESYVQEIGRAGRDGLPAHCHLFMDAKGNDENELRRHIHANSIDRHVIRKLLQKIFLPCSCKELCPKHEVAFSIEETVRALDIPEENISTLLCYLELHENKYIELLSPAYTVCKVISYGGPNQIAKAAKECPPLAMALALQKNKSDTQGQTVIEFAVVDIAAAIGWDSGICKHKLKNFEWTTVNGLPKRSTLNVQFSNLGFRLLAPGNLTGEQLDEALDSLYEHVTHQEKTSLLQLRAVHQTLIEVAAPTYHSCLSEETFEGNIKLKTRIREYFDSPNPLESVSLEETKILNEDLLVNSIRSLISTYKDNTFTGRAVARILHGISSPNYPAVIWGRCKYWRSFINTDFHSIIRIATREILHFR